MAHSKSAICSKLISRFKITKQTSRRHSSHTKTLWIGGKAIQIVCKRHEAVPGWKWQVCPISPSLAFIQFIVTKKGPSKSKSTWDKGALSAGYVMKGNQGCKWLLLDIIKVQFFSKFLFGQNVAPWIDRVDNAIENADRIVLFRN